MQEQVQPEQKPSRDRRAYMAQWAERNKERIKANNREHYLKNRDKYKARNERYRNEKAAEIKAYHAEYYVQNKDAVNARNAAYYRKNKVARCRKNYARKLERYASDPLYRARVLLGVATGRLVRHGWKKTGKTSKMIGCSWEQLRAHIEAQFEPGMTWDNYGYKTWHIDHIYPISAIDPQNEAECRRVLHYTNLRPMWAVDNMRKNNRIAA